MFCPGITSNEWPVSKLAEYIYNWHSWELHLIWFMLLTPCFLLQLFFVSILLFLIFLCVRTKCKKDTHWTEIPWNDLALFISTSYRTEAICQFLTRPLGLITKAISCGWQHPAQLWITYYSSNECEIAMYIKIIHI